MRSEKICKIHQKNTCARISFLIKLQASSLQLYQKRDSGTGVFLWTLRNFSEHLFYRTHIHTFDINNIKRSRLGAGKRQSGIHSPVEHLKWGIYRTASEGQLEVLGSKNFFWMSSFCFQIKLNISRNHRTSTFAALGTSPNFVSNVKDTLEAFDDFKKKQKSV